MGEGLRVINDARDLFFKIYNLTKKYPEFKFTLNSQIIRAAISVGSNVTEGQRRGKKEFSRYIDIAIGSCDEVKYQLSLYKTSYDADIFRLCDKIIGQLVNLKKTLNPKP